MTTVRTWPDTTDVPVPTDHPYSAALWLVGRHPRLATMVDRVPCLVTGGEGAPQLDLDALASAFGQLDRSAQEWADYERCIPAPEDELEYERWLANGPVSSPAAHAVGCMSRGERIHLLLLATFAGTHVPFSVRDLVSLDGAGRRLLVDWAMAVLAA